MTLLWKNIQQRYRDPTIGGLCRIRSTWVGRLAMKKRGLYPIRCQCLPGLERFIVTVFALPWDPNVFCDEVR